MHVHWASHRQVLGTFSHGVGQVTGAVVVVVLTDVVVVVVVSTGTVGIEDFDVVVVTEGWVVTVVIEVVVPPSCITQKVSKVTILFI